MAVPAPDSEALLAAKQAVRASMRAFLSTVDDASRAAWSVSAAGHLRARLGEVVAPGGVVAVFASQRMELDTGPLLAGGGFSWAFPAIVGGDLVFRACSPDGLRTVGALREPPEDAPVVVPGAFVVPGRAFDPAGNRLGRGKGYYDRALAAHPDIRAIGLCFGGQLLAEVPAGPRDVAVDEVVTERGAIRCDPGRRRGGGA